MPSTLAICRINVGVSQPASRCDPTCTHLAVDMVLLPRECLRAGSDGGMTCQTSVAHAQHDLEKTVPLCALTDTRAGDTQRGNVSSIPCTILTPESAEPD